MTGRPSRQVGKAPPDGKPGAETASPPCRPAGIRSEPRPGDASAPDGRPRCPYRGLTPYTEDDAEYFFGRDADRDLVIANLMASRLTLLYGPSGVGKSSLLRAGVVRRLRDVSSGEFSYLAVGHVVVVYYASWAEDPLMGLGAALRAAAAEELDATPPARAELPDDAPLSVSLLNQVSERLDADVYLLFDQFEEITLYHDERQTQAFAAELGRIVAAPDLHVGILVGIRDDAVSKLDRFKPDVPGVLDNYLRLAHLRPPAAREAIERPLKRYNEQVDEPDRMTLEDGLVDDLLAQLRTGRVTVGDLGQGGTEVGGAADDATIETPFLQLVMTRLWATERAAGSTTLRRETLKRLGGAEGIVRNHLDAVMATFSPHQLDVAAQVMRYLVTPSGSKVANSAESLAYFAGADSTEVAEVLEALSGGEERILRPVPPPVDQPGPPLYEVFHDVLAPAVLEWRRRYVAAKERAEAEAALAQAREEAEARDRASRRELHRTRLLAGVLACLLVAVTGLVAAAVMVVQSRRETRIKELLASSEQEMASDPAEALHDALAAYDIRPGPAARAVRNALDADLSVHTLRGHRGVVVTGEYSADGTRIVTAGADGTARVMDAGTGRLVAVLPAETGSAPSPLAGATLSPDGSQLVAVSGNGRIRVAEARTGRLLTVIDDFRRKVNAPPPRVVWTTVAGRAVLLASARYMKGEKPAAVPPPALYDTSTGRAIRRFATEAGQPGTGAYQAALSRDGKQLLSVGSDTRVSVRDVASGRLLARSGPMGSEVGDAHFVTPQSSRIALLVRHPGVDRWRVAFWTWRGNAPLAAPAGGDAPGSELSSNLAVSQDGRIVAAGLDKRAGIYDAATGKPIGFTPEQPDWVNQVGFSPDARLFATAGEDGQILVWKSGFNNRPLAQLLGHRGGVSSIAFNPKDANTLLSTSLDGTALTWRLPARTVFTDGDWIRSASSSRDGSTILTLQRQGILKIWHPGQRDPVKTIPLSPGPAYLDSAVIAPDGNTVVATTSHDARPVLIRWRDPGTPQPIPLEANARGSWPSTVTVSQDGRQVAAGNGLNEVTIWNLTTRKLVRALPSLGVGQVSALAFVGDAGELAVASSDGTVRIWDPGQQKPRLTLSLPGQVGVESIAVSPDQQRLVTTSGDHVLRVWRLSDGRREAEIEAPIGSRAGISFSPDGNLLAVGVADSAVHIYNWRMKRMTQEVGLMRRHGDAINDVDFLPDGRLLSASDDGTAAIYECSVCQSLRKVIPEAEARDRMHQNE